MVGKFKIIMPDPSIQHEILHMLYLSIHWIQLAPGIQNQAHLVKITDTAMIAPLFQLQHKQQHALKKIFTYKINDSQSNNVKPLSTK